MASGRAGSFHSSKQELGRAPKARQRAGRAPALQGDTRAGVPGCCDTAPCSAPSPWGGGAEARSGGRRSFLPPGELNAGSRTLPPWRAACLSCCCKDSPPTSGVLGGRDTGRLVPQGWAGAPGVGCPLLSAGWPGSGLPSGQGVSVSWGSAALSQPADVGVTPGVP